MPTGKYQRKPYSQEYKDNMSKVQMGHFVSVETREKLRQAMINRKKKFGCINNSITRKRLSKKLSGRKLSKEHSIKIGLGNKGKTISLENRIKVGLALVGKKFTAEHRKNISLSHIGLYAGSKHPLWQGGSKEYTSEWTSGLKESIRKRDKYRCHLCHSTKNKRKFDVHHIDYDKKNCKPNNLITLCLSCHVKTNTKRERWTKYFTNYMDKKREQEIIDQTVSRCLKALPEKLKILSKDGLLDGNFDFTTQDLKENYNYAIDQALSAIKKEFKR